MESTGVIDIVGSSPLPKRCCGEVYGHDEGCEAFKAGRRSGMALALNIAIDAMARATPFPFKATAGDKYDMDGPFAFYGLADSDEQVDRVERIIGHYLLAARDALSGEIGKELVRRNEDVPGWTSKW